MKSDRETTRGGEYPLFSRPAPSLPHDPLFMWVMEQAGIDGQAYRSAPMHRRISSCLRKLRSPCRESARSRLEKHPALLNNALDAVLIGVSGFFRDADVSHALRHGVLPTLSRQHDRVRILSAGCSTGQELYSIALMQAAAGALEKCELLGVDARPSALEFARRGVFAREEFAPTLADWCERFVLRSGAEVRIDPAICAQTQWHQADLLTTVPAGPWQMILFRNVSIYLEEDASTKLWARLGAQLAPGGFLVTGKAERPPGSLGLRRMGPSIYQKPFIAS